MEWPELLAAFSGVPSATAVALILGFIFYKSFNRLIDTVKDMSNANREQGDKLYEICKKEVENCEIRYTHLLNELMRLKDRING